MIPRAIARLLASAIWVAALVLAVPSIAWSIEPNHQIKPLVAQSPYRFALTQFQHRAYLSRDGAPGNAQDIVQTPDGFLWIASQSGLVRFDGVNFDRTPTDLLPKASVSRLFAETNGDLWIGYTFGGISVLREGKLSNVPDADLPGGSVVGIVRAKDGTLWVASTRGIARRRGDRWEKLGPKDGDPGHEPQWIGLIDGRIHIFEPREAYVVDDATGRLVPTDFKKAKQGQLGLPAAASWKDDFNLYWATLRDPSGSLWAFKDGTEGVTRIRWNDVGDAIAGEEHFRKLEGLSGEIALVFFMDRESNVWVATELGIDRFSMGKFTPVLFPVKLADPTIAADRSNGLWVGSRGEHAFYLKGDAPMVSVDELGPGADCAMVDRRGAIWLPGPADMRVYDGAKVTHVAPPAGVLKDDHGVMVLQACQGVAEDVSGNIWLSIVKEGVYRRSGDTWQLNGGLKALPSGPSIRVMADPRGRIWLSYPKDRIAVVDHDKVTLYGPEEGLAIGNVLSLSVDGAHIWAAGDKGIAYLDAGSRFVTIRAAGGNSLRGISGIVESEQGDLWLNSPEGVYMIAAHEIDALIRSPDYQPTYKLFTQEDGINGQPLSIRPGPTMVATTDGRIWVTTKRDLAWIDPSHIRFNRVAPTTTITGLTANGKSWPLSSVAELPPSASNLRINYTAPALSMPERVRFRYRLQGVDDEWQDAGARREAFYTSLTPGAYHFEVVAFNEDGVASSNAANLNFEVNPAFYQTLWFRTLLVITFLLVVWLAYVMRVSLIARRYRLLLHERSAERERIARDLHDTLLQDMQGILLQIELWARGSALSDAQRDSAIKIEDKMRNMLIDGRDTISALRHSQDHQVDLVADVLDVGNEVSGQSETRFSLRLLGEPRPLRNDTCEETLAIIREAMLNAFRHADAEVVWVTINYAPQALAVSISDNGRGVSERQIEERQKEGHWGIAGMRERAAKLGVQLMVTSAPNNGTIVELEVPRRRAYATDPFLTRVGTSLRIQCARLSVGRTNRKH